jgi:hypothetical protein
MTVLENLKNLLGGASAAIANLRRAELGIRERLGALDREEVALLSLAAPPAELEGNLRALVSDLGRRWTEAHAGDLVRDGSGRVERSLGPVERRSPDVLAPGRLPAVFDGPVSVAMLAGVCPDLLVAGLIGLAQSVRHESGPPLAERLARLADIQAERERLETEHAQLVDEADRAGLTLQHLQGETARRLAGAARREAGERDGVANRDLYRRNPSARPPEPAA